MRKILLTLAAIMMVSMSSISMASNRGEHHKGYRTEVRVVKHVRIHKDHGRYDRHNERRHDAREFSYRDRRDREERYRQERLRDRRHHRHNNNRNTAGVIVGAAALLLLATSPH